MKGGPTEKKCQAKSGREPECYEIDMVEASKDNKTKTTKQGYEYGMKPYTQMYGIKSCYHKVHEKAYRKNVSGSNTNQSVTGNNAIIQQIMQVMKNKAGNCE